MESRGIDRGFVVSNSNNRCYKKLFDKKLTGDYNIVVKRKRRMTKGIRRI